jgi:DNA-binding HxlR family transcriptional regulator
MGKIGYEELQKCPVTATMDLIGGKWKILVLHLINNDINRFGKMSLMLRDISKQMLTTQLRELENDGLIARTIYPEIPPRVEYHLTERGKSLLPILESMKDWGMANVIEPARALAASGTPLVH